jgi:hypothetical protein
MFTDTFVGAVGGRPVLLRVHRVRGVSDREMNGSTFVVDRNR